MPIVKSLYWKLTLAFALVAFLTAALVTLFIRLTSADRLSDFILEQQRATLAAALQEYYAANGSWEGVSYQWHALQKGALVEAGATPAPGESWPGQPYDEQAYPLPEAGYGQTYPPPGEGYDKALPPRDFDRGMMLGLADAQGLVLVSVDRSAPVGGQLSAAALDDGLAVVVEDVQVGTILTARQWAGFNPQEAMFLQRTTQAVILAGAAALLVALILGVLLAQTFTRPLKALTTAAQKITAGELEQQVPVRTQDEIGQLAAAFNRMSQEVARVHYLRRQMTADIAHDLRTPLTVISGYIESMRDGVLKPTPERLALIYAEIQRLQDLVGDLRLLSLADAGELPLETHPVAPQAVLERAAGLFRHPAEQQGIRLAVEAAPGLPEFQADESRLMQVLDNLVSNALRHTPSGGRVTLAGWQEAGRLVLSVRDTGQGIQAGDLPNVFNRFYRADSSRHAETGESGLGLAIVKALVEAHGGSVSVVSEPGQGADFRLSFPL